MNITAPLLWRGVFVAGGVGAWCRFRLDGLIARHWSRSVPAGTFTINVLGSFGLGLLTGLAAAYASLAPLTVVLGTGMMGGFTTFSTANVEVVRLMLSGRPGAGIGLDVATLVVAGAAAVLGLFLGGLW